MAGVRQVERNHRRSKITDCDLEDMSESSPMQFPPRALLLSLCMIVYALIVAAGCSGGQGSTDAGMDAGPACGTGRFESFDWQCKSHVGCQALTTPGCDCRCTRCNNEECVEQVCEPACPADAGTSDGQNDIGTPDTGKAAVINKGSISIREHV